MQSQTENMREDAIPLWEQFGAGFVLLMLTGALIGPVLAPDQGENPVLRLFWLPSYAITAGLCLWRIKDLLRIWPAIIMLGLLVLLALASRYWSLDPATTQRRVMAMAINGMFALYLGARFRGAALPRLLSLAALWMAVLSLVFVFAMPSVGVHHGVNDGLWRGVWYEKNQMGLYMVIGGISAAAWQATLPKPKLWPLLTLGLCTLLMLATASKTSLICLMLGLGLIVALKLIRRGGPALAVVAVWFGVVCLGAGWWIWTEYSATLLTALGKDPTLTGRTGIWAEVLAASEKRPLLGYGYNAFWGLESAPANWIRYQTGWIVPSAHNGWLDVLLGLGWVGVTLAGLTVVMGYLGNLFRLNRAGTSEGFWCIAYLSVFMALSFSESVVLSPQSLPWALCLTVLARAFDPKAGYTVAPNPLNPHPVPNPYVRSRLRPVA